MYYNKEQLQKDINMICMLKGQPKIVGFFNTYIYEHAFFKIEEKPGVQDASLFINGIVHDLDSFPINSVVGSAILKLVISIEEDMTNEICRFT